MHVISSPRCLLSTQVHAIVIERHEHEIIIFGVSLTTIVYVETKHTFFHFLHKSDNCYSPLSDWDILTLFVIYPIYDINNCIRPQTDRRFGEKSV